MLLDASLSSRTKMTPEDIARIAVREHDFEDAEARTEAAEALVAKVKVALSKPESLPAFSSTSRPLSIVRFRALLQDTGYPAEVYLPSDAGVQEEPAQPVDWSKLGERWVGWGVEVPGEQDWARQTTTTDVAEELAALNLSTLPPALKGKHPLPLPEYTGALLKVYSDFSPSPASVYDVVGVVSSAAMPSPYTGDEEEEVTLVPAIHVLVPPTPFSSGSKPAASDPTVRTELVDYLASAFNPPDKVAGELLLLALLARPAARPTALPPLGTFNLNLVRPKTDSAALETTLASLHPHTLPLQLTIPLLHSSHFRPSSTDGTSLTPGLLQLAPGTLLQINEDGLGDGGALAQNALQNLQALTEALDVQSVHYQYPYMDSLRIECALRSVITSEGKSLLPADAVLPVTLAESYTPPANLAAFRAYLSAHGSLEHATALTIPDAIAEMIQDQFVSERKAGKGSVEAAEARLKRRMKIARVLALSHGDELTPRIWEQALALDDEVEKRNVQREEKRREGKIGAPNPNTEIELD